MIAWAWLKEFYDNNIRRLKGIEPGNGIIGKCLDLSHDVVSVTIKTSKDFDLRTGRLVFWFQTFLRVDGGKSMVTVNYAFRDPVKLRGSTVLTLTSDVNDWICFGARDDDRFPDRGSRYGCAANQKEFEEAISNVAGDFGFIFLLKSRNLLPLSFPDNSPAIKLPTGSITLKDLAIRRGS